jgi:hypothetical protein
LSGRGIGGTPGIGSGSIERVDTLAGDWVPVNITEAFFESVALTININQKKLPIEVETLIMIQVIIMHCGALLVSALPLETRPPHANRLRYFQALPCPLSARIATTLSIIRNMVTPSLEAYSDRGTLAN